MLAFLCFAPQAFASNDLSTEQLTGQLHAVGFTCTAGSNSTRCRGKIGNYSQPINIYVPSYFSAHNPVSLAFHFMGYTTSSAFDPFTQANGDYGTYLAASQQNALLVVPESKGSDTTFTNDLSTPAKLDTFFKNVQALLTRAGVAVDDTTPRVLSGHSGAYMVLGKIGQWAAANQVPALNSVRGFALFDCGYGYREGLESILHVMRSHGHSAYFSAFNPTNSDGKKETNLRLENDFGPAADLKFIQNSKISHMEFMRTYMTEFFDFAL